MSRYRNPGIVVFEASDIPGSEINGLDQSELLVIFQRRFHEAGKPWDKLTNWLDDHYIGAKSGDPEQRLLSLDWFGLSVLMREAGLWRDEVREEKHPPRGDLS
jgi:hypothetical protein